MALVIKDKDSKKYEMYLDRDGDDIDIYVSTPEGDEILIAYFSRGSLIKKFLICEEVDKLKNEFNFDGQYIKTEEI
jgi:hypothetical protein